MDDNTISFRYSAFTYKFSFLNTISNVRAFYPTENIFVYLDDNRKDLDFYKIVSKKYNLNIVLTKNHVTYIHRDEPLESVWPKSLERFRRILHCAENCNTKWIISLEDDVQLRRKLINFPKSDFGTNRENIGFVGGGGIMKASTVKEVLNKITLDELYELHYQRKDTIAWATDAMLRVVFSQYNCTKEKWVELAEPDYYDDTDYGIFHGCKILHELDNFNKTIKL
jgi:hypothetical protein